MSSIYEEQSEDRLEVLHICLLDPSTLEKREGGGGRVDDKDSARPHRLLALPSYMMAGGQGRVLVPRQQAARGPHSSMTRRCWPSQTPGSSRCKGGP